MKDPGREAEDPRQLEEALQAGHEADAVGSTLLWRSALAFFGLLAVGMLVVYVVQPLMVKRQEAEWPAPNPLASAYGHLEPPAPRLQVDPSLDIHEQHKWEDHVLTTYGWVDRSAGVVRIPIDRAMALLAERGETAAAASAQAAPAGAQGAKP